MFIRSARCGAPCIRVEFTNVKQSNKGEGGRSSEQHQWSVPSTSDHSWSRGGDAKNRKWRHQPIIDDYTRLIIFYADKNKPSEPVG